MALSVKEIAPAVAFYKSALGFSVVSQDAETAVLARDQVRLGLARKPSHRPEEAGSFAISVDDLEEIHREIQGKPGAEVGEIRSDTWGGTRYRIFFVREGENGYCYCLTRPESSKRLASASRRRAAEARRGDVGRLHVRVSCLLDGLIAIGVR